MWTIFKQDQSVLLNVHLWCQLQNDDIFKRGPSNDTCTVILNSHVSYLSPLNLYTPYQLQQPAKICNIVVFFFSKPFISPIPYLSCHSINPIFANSPTSPFDQGFDKRADRFYNLGQLQSLVSLCHSVSMKEDLTPFS